MLTELKVWNFALGPLSDAAQVEDAGVADDDEEETEGTGEEDGSEEDEEEEMGSEGLGTE